jgi:hypothetical protein
MQGKVGSGPRSGCKNDSIFLTLISLNNQDFIQMTGMIFLG